MLSSCRAEDIGRTAPEEAAMIRGALADFNQMAGTLATIELDEQAWATLGGPVAELVNRGADALALEADGCFSVAFRCRETDPPVLLARAFSKVHGNLAAAEASSLQPAPVVVASSVSGTPAVVAAAA
jgi:hypothetical protein